MLQYTLYLLTTIFNLRTVAIIRNCWFLELAIQPANVVKSGIGRNLIKTHLRVQLSVLASFPNLEDLDLWGGSFYTDGLCDLLQEIGHRLKKLSLVHVEEMDSKYVQLTFYEKRTKITPQTHIRKFEILYFSDNMYQ